MAPGLDIQTQLTEQLRLTGDDDRIADLNGGISIHSPIKAERLPRYWLSGKDGFLAVAGRRDFNLDCFLKCCAKGLVGRPQNFPRK